MHEFRVTKYDPAFRNELGRYTREEWMSFSDVGRSDSDSVLTMSEYELVEDSYLEAAVGFLDDAGVRTLSVRGLENRKGSPSAPPEGAELSGSKLVAAMRGVLREEFWCRFEGPAAFVHFGWDYYMYLGVPAPSDAVISKARALGLFVEPFVSPYRTETPHQEGAS